MKDGRLKIKTIVSVFVDFTATVQFPRLNVSSPARYNHNHAPISPHRLTKAPHTESCREQGHHQPVVTAEFILSYTGRHLGCLALPAQ